jgi:hypothetical protein
MLFHDSRYVNAPHCYVIRTLHVLLVLHAKDISKQQIRQHLTYCGFLKEATSHIHSITGHEGPEGAYRYSSTLSSTSMLDVGG